MQRKNYIKKSLILSVISEVKEIKVIFTDESTKTIKFKFESFEKPKNKSREAYLDYERILRLFGMRRYDSLDSVAEQIVKILFADNRTNFFRITLIQEGKPDEIFTYNRKKTCLGPKPSRSILIVCLFIRLYGNVIKFMAYPFHFLFPKKRWGMPILSPAKIGYKGNSTIPRKIWQTNFTEKCSFSMWVNYLRNRRLSKDFEHHYVSTEDREKYLVEHASKRVLDAYMMLNDGAAQADLWRLIVLYNEGGIYMDMDASLFRPLSKIIENKDYVYLWDRKHFSNYFIATKANNPLIKEFIDEVVYRIENRKSGKYWSVYTLTGPGAADIILDRRNDIEFYDYHYLAGQGIFVNEKYQYIDRPNSKWIYNKNFFK